MITETGGLRIIGEFQGIRNQTKRRKKFPLRSPSRPGESKRILRSFGDVVDGSIVRDFSIKERELLVLESPGISLGS